LFVLDRLINALNKGL